MPEPHLDLDEPEHRRGLRRILRQFDDVYRLNGRYRMRFCVRRLPDSDGTPLADVYLVPDAASRKNHDRNYFHIEVLEDELPPELLGFVYDVTITPTAGAENPSWMTVNAETPVEEAGAEMSEEAILSLAS